MFGINKKKKEKKIYNLIETQVTTYGDITNVRTKVHPYDTFDQALDAIETYAKAFEQASQGEYEVCVRLCDDRNSKVLVSRDYNFPFMRFNMHEIRLIIKESYI